MVPLEGFDLIISAGTKSPKAEGSAGGGFAREVSATSLACFRAVRAFA
jgi:hypothetical protein